MISLLDGFHGMDDLLKICPQPWITWLLSTLDDRGLLADGPVHFPHVNLEIRGQGSVVEQLTHDLASLKGDGPPLQILAELTQEVDRVQVAHLVERRIPHLVVRTTDVRASVGPLVIPGVTSCMTCGDLHRRDLDPTWPIQAFQLSRIQTHPSDHLVSWVCAMATVHCRAYAQGLMPESALTSIEMNAHDGRQVYRSLPIHPQCPCRQ